jgi:hypothetical protein
MTLGLLLGLMGCAAESKQDVEETTATPELSSLSWTLEWDHSHTESTDSGGWVTTNDQGYRVEVDSGWAVLYALSLVPCDLASKQPETSVWGWLFGRSAWANHAPFDDPSLVEFSIPERLDPPIDQQLGPIQFPVDTYCDTFWLVARGDPGTESDGTSLALTGTWSRGDMSGRVELDSDFALALYEPLSTVPVATRGLHVTLRRSMHTLFDGIDFENDNHDTQAWRTVSNLIEDTDVVIEPL